MIDSSDISKAINGIDQNSIYGHVGIFFVNVNLICGYFFVVFTFSLQKDKAFLYPNKYSFHTLKILIKY